MDKTSVFEQLNQYFDHIYVVTLDGYTARQESIKTHFSGLNYSFWQGTDKRQLDESVLNNPELYDDKAHKEIKRTTRSLVLGEYACSMSHRRIYQDMVDKNYKNALILEDDVIPIIDRLSDFNKELQTVEGKWDLMLLGYYDAQYPSLRCKAKQFIYRLYHTLHIANWHKVPKQLIDKIPMRDFNKYFYSAGRSYGTHAYALNQKAAKQYIDYQTPVILQADRIFYYYQVSGELTELAVKKPMFGLGEEANISTINQRG